MLSYILESPPYIRVRILKTNETQLSAKELLQQVKTKFDRVHGPFSRWEEGDKGLSLVVTYPDLDTLAKNYQYGTGIFDKIVELVYERHFPLHELFAPGFGHETEQAVHPAEPSPNYLVLKYETNHKEILRKNYEYMQKIVPLVGPEFYIEEISDGFIMFYRRKEDFLAGQMDLMNYNDVLGWIRSKHVDESHPAVKAILQFIQEAGSQTK